MNTRARKKTFFVVAAICMSLCMPSAFAASHKKASEVEAQPSIQVKELVYDFGEIMEGSEVEHEFIVRNTGTADLNIERVQVD